MEMDLLETGQVPGLLYPTDRPQVHRIVRELPPGPQLAWVPPVQTVLPPERVARVQTVLPREWAPGLHDPLRVQAQQVEHQTGRREEGHPIHVHPHQILLRWDRQEEPVAAVVTVVAVVVE